MKCSIQRGEVLLLTVTLNVLLLTVTLNIAASSKALYVIFMIQSKKLIEGTISIQIMNVYECNGTNIFMR